MYVAPAEAWQGGDGFQDFGLHLGGWSQMSLRAGVRLKFDVLAHSTRQTLCSIRTKHE